MDIGIDRPELLADVRPPTLMQSEPAVLQARQDDTGRLRNPDRLITVLELRIQSRTATTRRCTRPISSSIRLAPSPPWQRCD